MTANQMIAIYGKTSRQYQQYRAVLQESEIIHRFGENSPEHRSHKAYMRIIGIPVI